MSTLKTNGCIRTQSSVLLYLLNLEKGRKFVAESNGSKCSFSSAKNAISAFKKGSRKQYALTVSDSEQTLYFIEPIFVESFPVADDILRFHCKETIIKKN